MGNEDGRKGGKERRGGGEGGQGGRRECAESLIIIGLTVGDVVGAVAGWSMCVFCVCGGERGGLGGGIWSKCRGH